MKPWVILCGLLITTGSQAAEPAPGAAAPLVKLAAPAGMIKLDGRPAPALKLTDLDGKKVDLAQSHGRWALVHFWATWCGPCRREMPTLAQLMQALPAERLSVVLVNTAESEDEVFAFLASVSPELGTLLDRDGQVTERWQPRGLPASFLVDPQGRLRYLVLGGREWASGAYLNFLRELTAK